MNINMYVFYLRCCVTPKAMKVATGVEYLVLVGAVVLAGTVCGTLGITIVYFIYIVKVRLTYYINMSKIYTTLWLFRN